MSGATGLRAGTGAQGPLDPPPLSAGSESSDRKIGGFSVVSTTGHEVKSAATFAVKAQQAALRRPASGQDDPKAKTQPVPRLALVRIVGAEHQVVAGLNYRLQLRVTLDGEEKDRRGPGVVAGLAQARALSIDLMGLEVSPVQAAQAVV